MKIAISQPTFLPWLGYFDLIDQVEVFVILDSVQFEKRSWQQRNKIKTLEGLQWLTVPVLVQGRFEQLVREVQLQNPDCLRKHARTLEHNYRHAPWFETYFRPISSIFDSVAHDLSLANLNVRIIEWMMDCLGIKVQLKKSSELGCDGKRSQLLVNICEALSANSYLSPIGSAGYLLAELDLFEQRNIEVTFQHYEHPRYRQQFGEFIPYAATLDLLFNEGERAGEIVRSGRRAPFRPEEVALMPVATEKA
jgi:WbqC-like protein